MYGPSLDLDDENNRRRTVYGHVSRGRLNTLLKLYDFPDPTQTSPGRDLTTTSLQQLFVLNSTFIQKQAAVLADAVAAEPDDAARIRRLYRKILARDPRPSEMETAKQYLASGTMAQWAQVLLSTNEEIFWP
jgi:purine nucleoside permease